jgi:RsiG-like
MQTQERQASGRAGARQRAVPRRSPLLAHLALPALRDYRRELAEEEGRVSYWRRLVQARIDVLVADPGSLARLQAVLTDSDASSRRGALLAMTPADDVPPLPDLDILWREQPEPGDDAALDELLVKLATVESTLSSYRSALHERIDRATEDLIARYREDPAACLDVLPLQRVPGVA